MSLKPVQIMMRPELKEMLKRASKEGQVSMSDFVRPLIVEKLCLLGYDAKDDIEWGGMRPGGFGRKTSAEQSENKIKGENNE